MNDKQTRDFKIRLDEEIPDSIFVKKPAKQRVKNTKRPGRTWPVITAVLMVLMIGALVGVYLDMRGRMDRIDISGAQKTRNISLDLQSKFSSLSVKFAHLEDTVSALGKVMDDNSKLTAKKTGELEASLGTQRSEITKLKSNMEKTKSDQTGQAKKISSLTKDITAVTKDIKQVKGSIAPLETTIKNNRKALDKEQKKTVGEMAALEKRITALTRETTALKANDTKFEQQHSQFIEKIKQQEVRAESEWKKRASTLASQLADLEKKVSAIATAQKKIAESKPAAAPPAPAPSAVKERSGLKPGEVIEQDIR